MPNFGNNINLNKFELQNAVIQNLAVAPSDPKEGQIYFDTVAHKKKVYENGVWVAYSTTSHNHSHDNLTGVSADDHHSQSHAFAGTDHEASTLADVNSKISDATLIDTNDSRLSDARTPTEHSHAHSSITDVGTDDHHSKSHSLGSSDHTATTLSALNGKITDAELVDKDYVSMIGWGAQGYVLLNGSTRPVIGGVDLSYTEDNTKGATGNRSFAAGKDNKAAGQYSSIPGGLNNTVTGDYSSIIGGKDNSVGALYATAGGDTCVANGKYSFVHGFNLQADGMFQTIFGSYNAVSGSTSTVTNQSIIFMVGNGTSETPSNALELTQEGNFKVAGTITDGTNNVLSAKLDANAPITPGTKTKITYDANGLVTSGTTATMDDFNDGATYKKTHNDFTDTLKAKLDGIATGANNFSLTTDCITTSHITDKAVTLAKVQDIGGLTFLGNHNGTAGTPEAMSMATARSILGIANVDDTSDIDKPISSSTQSALDAKLDKNDTIIASTKTKITYDANGLVTGGASATMDDILDGTTYKRTHNDYTDTDKGKVDNITITSSLNLNTVAANAATGASHATVTTGNPHNVTKTNVGLGNVDNTSDADKPVSTATSTALDLKQNLTAKGAANGYAGLDANGKVPTSQLPSTVLGGLQYQGTFQPSLEAYPSSPETGDYWIATDSGTIAADSKEYAVGDWAVYNGASWDKIDNSDHVTSVAGKTGAVSLQAADITDFDAEVSNNTTVASAMQRKTEIIGDGVSTEFSVNHGFGTRYVHVAVMRTGTPYDEIITDVEHTDLNNVTVRFGAAPTTNEYTVIVIG